MSEQHTFFNVITFPDGDEACRAIGRSTETRSGVLGSTLYRNRREPRSGLDVERMAGLYDTVESFGGG